MVIGFHLTPFWSPTDRHPTQILDEAIEVVSAASRMGYAWVSIGHHMLSYPTVWPQPLPVLADAPLESWTICGAPADCVEAIGRARAMGLDGIGLAIYSLPREPKARIDYLQMIAEDIVRPAVARDG